MQPVDIADPASVDAGDESGMAVACYARAMDHVGVMVGDPGFEWSERVVLDLHFDACFFQREASPGRWRTGPVSVTGPGGQVAYDAPDANRVGPLMGYQILQRVQGGRYSPDRDASPWLAFCIDAHLAQARRRLEQVEAAAGRWQRLERQAEFRGWPDRLVIALEQALVGGTDRTRYEREADVSSATASNDLRRLVDAGLLIQHGRGRSTRYAPTDALQGLVNAEGEAFR